MKTILYDKHLALEARLVEFFSWEMPLYYTSILAEHKAAREHVVLFDVSHMGRIGVEGNDAGLFLDFLSTNHIQDKPDDSATYTTWANENGGTVDDLLVFKENKDHFFVVVNASNRNKDLAHLQNYAKNYKVRVKDHYETDGILALQGPKSKDLLSLFFPECASLPTHHFFQIHDPEKLTISRTGYTGEEGFEIFGPKKQISLLWDKLLHAGKDFSILPAGLGARDTLRLEMGYALYGHELTEEISPIESVSHWTVKWKKSNFLGKRSMEQLNNSPNKRKEVGLLLKSGRVAREGDKILHKDRHIGNITSGNFSPTLAKPIAIGLMVQPILKDQEVEILIRGKREKATITSFPFINQKNIIS
jgi:aminomethyltransferase